MQYIYINRMHNIKLESSANSFTKFKSLEKKLN